MKKKIYYVLSLFIILMILAGCSSASSEEDTKIASAEDYQVYGEHLEKVYGEADRLLSTFSNSLDGLYTGTASEKQFAKIIKENIIEDSRNLVQEAESFNSNPNFFEVKQMVVNNLNSQHQLFLDAVNMVNEDKLNKGDLRSTYLGIKDEQANILNTWQQL